VTFGFSTHGYFRTPRLKYRELLGRTPVVVSSGGREHGAYGCYIGGTVARDIYPDRIVIYQDTLERDFGHDPAPLRAHDGWLTLRFCRFRVARCTDGSLRFLRTPLEWGNSAPASARWLVCGSGTSRYTAILGRTAVDRARLTPHPTRWLVSGSLRRGWQGAILGRVSVDAGAANGSRRAGGA
jgi:hypothetical protein